jgi:hypothetical protein
VGFGPPHPHRRHRPNRTGGLAAAPQIAYWIGRALLRLGWSVWFLPGVVPRRVAASARAVVVVGHDCSRFGNQRGSLVPADHARSSGLSLPALGDISPGGLSSSPEPTADTQPISFAKRPTHRQELTATRPATAVTLGAMPWIRWTEAARGRVAMPSGASPWTPPRWTFNPRVLGSNPSRPSSDPRHLGISPIDSAPARDHRSSRWIKTNPVLSCRRRCSPRTPTSTTTRPTARPPTPTTRWPG